MNIIASKYLLILIILSLSIACQQNSPKQVDNQSGLIERVASMEFEMDTSLLDKVYVSKEIGISIRPIKSWTALTEDSIKRVRMAMAKAGIANSFTYFEQAFVNETGLAFVSVSRYTHPKSDSIIRHMTSPEEVGVFYNPKKTWKDIQVTYFVYKDFTVKQILLLNDQVVNFKLIYLKPTSFPFQIDYMMPVEVYAEHIHAVESSIGSVELLKN